MPEPHHDPFPAAAVEDAIAKIRTYYATGTASLREHADRLPYGQTPPSTPGERLRKARAFATRYSLDDLKRLEVLCREHSFALGVSMIDRIATVRDKRQRQALEAKMIKLRWSNLVLDNEIRRRYASRRPAGGRKARTPHSAEDALAEILAFTTKFVRWGVGLGWNQETGRMPPLPWEFPPEVREDLKKALRAVRRLQQTAEEELESRRPQAAGIS